MTELLPLLKAEFERGRLHGYEVGFRDGQMHPDDLRKKMESQRTWVPKRKSDWPVLDINQGEMK